MLKSLRSFVVILDGCLIVFVLVAGFWVTDIFDMSCLAWLRVLSVEA